MRFFKIGNHYSRDWWVIGNWMDELRKLGKPITL
jgi:hypothetical protein